MATQVVAFTKPCQGLRRLNWDHFILQNHFKPLYHQIFHRSAA